MFFFLFLAVRDVSEFESVEYSRQSVLCITISVYDESHYKFYRLVIRKELK